MKSTDRNRIHFVGSIAGNNADEVFRTCCGAVGNYLARIPDGETGYRSKYISHLAHTVYARHPDVVTVSRPPPVDPDNPREWRKPGEDWIPMATDASDLWKFGLRRGVRTLRFETLGYAEAAIESYKAFCAVREQGIIPAGVRFQVSLPAAVDGMGFFVDRFADMRYFIPAYENAMAADIRRMLEVIPPGDLAIQWDNVASVLEHEARIAGHKLPMKIPLLARLLMGSPDKRFRQILKTFAANVPRKSSSASISVMATSVTSTSSSRATCRSAFTWPTKRLTMPAARSTGCICRRRGTGKMTRTTGLCNISALLHTFTWAWYTSPTALKAPGRVSELRKNTSPGSASAPSVASGAGRRQPSRRSWNFTRRLQGYFEGRMTPSSMSMPSSSRQTHSSAILIPFNPEVRDGGPADRFPGHLVIADAAFPVVPVYGKV